MASPKRHLPSAFSTRQERQRQTRAYAELWQRLGVTHELTISLGTHPRHFDPEVEFMPILRNLVRRATHVMRGLPKRHSLDFTGNHSDVVMLAGFYENTDASGLLFPHWHGAVSLRPGEERAFREILWDSIGADAKAPLNAFDPARTTRPLVKTRGAKPTFTLQPNFTTAARYIDYSNKHTLPADVLHWTTHDLLPPRQ